jgi:predicted esterase
MIIQDAGAQVYASGPQVLTYISDVDDSEQPYGLYVPPAFDPSKPYPLVLSLHGAGSNHRLNLRQVFGKGEQPGESMAQASRSFPPLPAVHYLVASVFARGTMGYQGLAETEVDAVLSDVQRRFHIDADRVYVTGLSMGGGGALWLGLTRPDRWAAIAPVCPAGPAGIDYLAPNALNLPVRLFQGAQDPVVPVGRSRQRYERLFTLGTPIDYVEYPDVRHDAWEYAYAGGAIFAWFDRCRRVPFPARVRFVSQMYKYPAAYWVHLDGLTPGLPASIEARFTAPNRLAITTQHLEGFTLHLAGHPQCARDQPLVVTIDGCVMHRHVGASLSFARIEQRWEAARYRPPPGSKRPGAEGPMAEALASRHRYVYGTGGGARAEELHQRRALAAHAAAWSSRHTRLAVAWAVEADTHVSEAEIRRSNLVLFGDIATNHLIARWSRHLPLELRTSAAGYGLVFIASLGERYVLVNSGLPWWTGAERSTRRAGMLDPLPRSPFRVLQRFGDYLLFKGSLDQVIAAGRFDRDWKVPAPEAAKMAATQAVIMHEGNTLGELHGGEWDAV